MAENNSFILCVDDEQLPLLLRKLVLEKQGYKVVTAGSASDALQALKEHRVDLVLTDQLMPGGTGTELAQSIEFVCSDMWKPYLNVIAER